MAVVWNNAVPAPQKENVSEEEGTSNYQPRNLDSSSSSAMDTVCPHLKSCQASWHLSVFQLKEAGVIQQSLWHFPSKNLCSDDQETIS